MGRREWPGSTKSRGHGKEMELEEFREGVVTMRFLSEEYLRGVDAISQLLPFCAGREGSGASGINRLLAIMPISYNSYNSYHFLRCLDAEPGRCVGGEVDGSDRKESVVWVWNSCR